MRLFLSTAEIGRTVLLPPDVPPDRVETARSAFAAMLQDPEFLADAKAQKLALAPLLGADLQRLNEDTFEASPRAIETARQIMGP